MAVAFVMQPDRIGTGGAVANCDLAYGLNSSCRCSHRGTLLVPGSPLFTQEPPQ